MMKALNPGTGAQKNRSLAPFWATLFQKLNRLCKLQLIVCPESAAHNKESLVSSYYQSLKKVYELLSQGVSFHDSDWIRDLQVNEHLRHWLDGDCEYEPELDINSIVQGEINIWTERFTINVDIPWRQEWIDDVRKQRDELSNEIGQIFVRWQTEAKKTFDDWFEEEALAFGRNHILAYESERKKYQDLKAGRRELTINDCFPSSSVKLILMIQQTLRSAGIRDKDAVMKTVEYLTSPSLKRMPFLKISSMLWAGVARKGASGQKRLPTRGMASDIETISTLLPYCDSMFIDDECRAYLNEEPLRTELDFGTALFSQSNKQEFLDYLDAIEMSMSEKHMTIIQGVYGPHWTSSNSVSKAG